MYRYWHKKAKNFYDKVVKPNNADVFLHFWMQENELHRVQLVNTFPSIVASRFELYSADVIESINLLHPNDTLPGRERVHNEARGNNYAMWRKHAACAHLIRDFELQNNFTYDIIMRVRPDLVFEDEIRFDECPKGKLCIPAVNDPRTTPNAADNQTTRWVPGSPYSFVAVNDQIAWGPRLLMMAYSNVYYWQAARRPIFKAERGLYDALQQMEILEYVWRPEKVYNYRIVHG